MASDFMKKNNKVRIANLIGDRRLMNYVWEYHGLTEDQSFHDYIFITNDKKYEFKNINTALDRIKIMSAKEFLILCNDGLYDAVFLHAIDSFPYAKIPLIPKGIKVFWMVWGYDLYDHPRKNPMIRMALYKPKTLSACPYLQNSLSLKNILRKIKKGIYSIFSSNYSSKKYIKAVARIDYFSGVLPNEYDLLKHVSYFKAKRVVYAYTSLEDMYDELPKTPPIIGNNILVGNSAAETNNHLDILDYIKDFKPADSKIISALSYSGPQKYIDVVVNAYRKVFGNNYKPLLKLMPPSEYNKIIESCGYGIFYHERQKGMGNINGLIMAGAKVFLSETSVAYKYYKSLGVHVFSVQTDLNPKSLTIPLSDEEKMYNIRTIGQFRTKAARIQLLYDIYKVIRDDKNL